MVISVFEYFVPRLEVGSLLAFGWIVKWMNELMNERSFDNRVCVDSKTLRPRFVLATLPDFGQSILDGPFTPYTWTSRMENRLRNGKAPLVSSSNTFLRQ